MPADFKDLPAPRVLPVHKSRPALLVLRAPTVHKGPRECPVSKDVNAASVAANGGTALVEVVCPTARKPSAAARMQPSEESSRST